MNKTNMYNIQLIKENTLQYASQSRITSSNIAHEFFRDTLKMDIKTEEYMYMIALNCKNDIIGCCEIAHGTINSACIHPRELFKRALFLNACNIIIAHNHPSGDCTPSNEDKLITARLKECSKILGISLLDHLIIGDNHYYSFKEHNKL